jgi:hypothetical protein
MTKKEFLYRREQRLAHIKALKDLRYNPRQCVGSDSPSHVFCSTDCRYLTAALSYWCGNQKAIEYNGTSVPVFHSCKFHKYKGRNKEEIKRTDRIRAIKKWFRRFL